MAKSYKIRNASVLSNAEEMLIPIRRGRMFFCFSKSKGSQGFDNFVIEEDNQADKKLCYIAPLITEHCLNRQGNA